MRGLRRGPSIRPAYCMLRHGRVGHRRMNRLRTFLALLGVLWGASAMARQPQIPRLSAISKGGNGPPTIVLLHGYSSSEKDWLPFAKSIQLPHGTRFIFPRGPEEEKRSDGAPPGRAWWHLDLSKSMHKGVVGADLSTKNPVGIEQAAQEVSALLDRRGNRTGQPFILGDSRKGPWLRPR